MTEVSRTPVSAPAEGSLWERDDEVYRVEKVYQAKERVRRKYEPDTFQDITLVKVILVEPMPHHCRLDVFNASYVPYDPDAE